MTMSLLAGGKLRSIHRGCIELFCPGCQVAHEINVHEKTHDGRKLGWNGESKEPSIAEPVRHDTPQGTCEYLLKDGILHYLSNCWHPLAGRSQPLPDFPR